MEDLQQKVINWVKTLKGWQCELAYRLLIKEKHYCPVKAGKSVFEIVET